MELANYFLEVLPQALFNLWTGRMSNTAGPRPDQGRDGPVRIASPEVAAMKPSLNEQFVNQLRPGLGLLMKARRCADDVDHSAWDFAVEISRLQQLGLDSCELRWLLCRGYLQHAIETTIPTQIGRSLIPTDCLQFADQSCFILTDEGVSFVGDLGARDRTSSMTLQELANTGASEAGQAPRWDADRRELRFGDELVKRFRVPAPNQQLVLSAFQEELWPERIDDPLPPVDEIDTKRRLHTTIHSLNRNQKNHLLHFHGDGQGDGVIWKASPDVVNFMGYRLFDDGNNQ